MTWLTGELHATGWISSAYPGLGIKGSDVTDNGTDGASVLFNDGLNPNDEYIVEWTTPFAVGTAEYFEDGSFILTGATDGEHQAYYQHYENNVAVGDPQLVTVTIGAEEQVIVAAPAAIRMSAPVLSISQSQQLLANPAAVRMLAPVLNVEQTTDQVISAVPAALRMRAARVDVAASQTITVAPAVIRMQAPVLTVQQGSDQAIALVPAALRMQATTPDITQQQNIIAVPGAVRMRAARFDVSYHQVITAVPAVMQMSAATLNVKIDGETIDLTGVHFVRITSQYSFKRLNH